METYYQDNHITIYNKDCRNMSELPDGSVQCVVTSPPYWGLRKYSGEQEVKEWGCAFGLETTPEIYIQHTIEILREIRRVLRKDGVVFWNIGDSYMGSGGNAENYPDTISGGVNRGRPSKTITNKKHPLIKPKNLCLIPFRIAIAAQVDGWWVRSDIIWSKPDPGPESVKDRSTKSHEYILMLTKSARYYWDGDAVKNPSVDKESYTGRRLRYAGTMAYHDKENYSFAGSIGENNKLRFGQIYPTRNIRTVWEITTKSSPEPHFAVFPEKIPEICIKAASRPQDIVLDPLAGTGTTLWVAKKLNRRAVGYEISDYYCQVILGQNRQLALWGGITNGVGGYLKEGQPCKVAQ